MQCELLAVEVRSRSKQLFWGTLSFPFVVLNYLRTKAPPSWCKWKWEQLQNTPQLIYMSLNKNSVYCVMPRSSKPPDTCKWGGPKLRGILKFSLEVLHRTLWTCPTEGKLHFLEIKFGSRKVLACIVKLGYLWVINIHWFYILLSLESGILFFIGYPNICTWCGIHLVVGSWPHELLISLRRYY